MRRLFSIMVALAAIAFVACETPNVTPTPPPTPEGYTLTLTSEQMLVFTAEGGSKTITYTLENPSEDVVLDVTVDNSWLVVVDKQTEGVITVMADENLLFEELQAKVTVTYGTQSFVVNAIQAPAADDTVVVKADTLVGKYYSEFVAKDLGNYWIILTDGGFMEDGSLRPDSQFYRLDIFGDLTTDENYRIPNGTYYLDMSNSGAKFSFAQSNSTYYTWKGEGEEVVETTYDEAMLKVNGTNIRLEATIDGAKHVVEFDGEYQLDPIFPDAQISTLKKDIYFDAEGYGVRCESYGDYWGAGACNWWIEFKPLADVDSYYPPESGVDLILDVITMFPNASGGIAGHYDASGFVDDTNLDPNFRPGVFVSGVRVSAEGHLMGSLYMEYKDDNVINQAPLTTGTLDVTYNYDGTYTIKLEAYDDDAEQPHKIVVDWTGTPTFV